MLAVAFEPKNKYPRRHRVGGKGNQKKRNRLEEEKTENKTKQMQFAAFQRCPPIDDPMLRNRNPGSPTDNGRRRWEMNESMNQWKNKVRRRSRAILVSWMAPVGVFLFCSVFFLFCFVFLRRPTDHGNVWITQHRRSPAAFSFLLLNSLWTGGEGGVAIDFYFGNDSRFPDRFDGGTLDAVLIRIRIDSADRTWAIFGVTESDEVIGQLINWLTGGLGYRVTDPSCGFEFDSDLSNLRYHRKRRGDWSTNLLVN